MTPTRRARLQLVVGLVVIALAVWVVLDRTGALPQETPPTHVTHTTPGPTKGADPPSSSSAKPTPDSGLPRIRESQLPLEGRKTLGLIRAGGPYPYARDGMTFENRERVLPRRPRGYYEEFTVPTPGEDDRGARRIVIGDSGDLYYTDDHYDSFRQVEEQR